MLHFVKQFFYHLVLLFGFTVFFCFLFLSTIHAIANASKAIAKQISPGVFPTPTPTQFGMILSNAYPTPQVYTVEARQPETTVIPSPLPRVQRSYTTISKPVSPVIQQTFPQVNPNDDAVWYRLAQCESGVRWNINTGNGFYGGLQFTLGTWAGVGGVGNPANASKEEQIYRAKILESRRGFEPWPECSRKLGLR